MGKFILRRLLLLIPILLGLTLLVFLFIRALPGDPAGAILGERATPEALERVRQALGLNKPLIDQYLAYLTGIIRFDLGPQLHHQPGRHRRLPAALPRHHRADAGGHGLRDRSRHPVGHVHRQAARQPGPIPPDRWHR